VRSPKTLPPAPAAVWRVIACLVALSTVRYELVSGPAVQAKRDQLADERYEQTRREHWLFWRTVAIATIVGLLVAARLVVD
jgi:hypothetical protein